MPTEDVAEERATRGAPASVVRVVRMFRTTVWWFIAALGLVVVLSAFAGGHTEWSLHPGIAVPLIASFVVLLYWQSVALPTGSRLAWWSAIVVMGLLIAVAVVAAATKNSAAAGAVWPAYALSLLLHSDSRCFFARSQPVG